MFGKVHVDAFLIGSPKCGTTWLADALGTHPDLCISDPKEVNELSDHRGTFARLPREIDWERYESCFQTEGIRVDASIHAFSDPDAPPKWANWYPQAKFILCIRHPVERTVSHWNMIRNGELEARYDISWQNFEKAWLDVRLHSESLYGRSMERWLRYFDINSFLILNSDHMKTQPQVAVDSMCDFLGVQKLQLDPNLSQTKHVTREKRALTVTGKMLRRFSQNRHLRILRSRFSALGKTAVNFPLLSRRAHAIECSDYHHFVCHKQILPDLAKFAELTNFDCENWIATTQQAAARLSKVPQ